jgi:hypothetical protein
MPKRTRGLACEKTKHTSIVTTGLPERSGLPCAMVLTTSFALSLVIGLSCHHPRRDALGIIDRLTSASRCQDHTTSPSAIPPLVWRRHHVHRIPHPTFVTIAIRPSCEAGRAKSNH